MSYSRNTFQSSQITRGLSDVKVSPFYIRLRRQTYYTALVSIIMAIISFRCYIRFVMFISFFLFFPPSFLFFLRYIIRIEFGRFEINHFEQHSAFSFLGFCHAAFLDSLLIQTVYNALPKREENLAFSHTQMWGKKSRFKRIFLLHTIILILAVST